MGYVHHGTIRKYTAVMLDIFNDLEIQYKDSNSVLHSANIPVKFSSLEKAQMLDEYSIEQILSGNSNVLPRASLSLTAVQRSETRMSNKNVKINTVKKEDLFEFQYNSMPYQFMYQLTVQCRGMNEASMIIEQIAPKFNPTLNVDVYDGMNLNEPTRIPIKLLDFSIDFEEYNEISTNLVTVSCSLQLEGNLYPPIKTVDRIKDFKILFNERVQEDTFSRRVIMGWDVDDEGLLKNEEIIIPNNNVPEIIDILCNSYIKIGENDLFLVYEDKDNLINELTFNWEILSGDATITFNKEFAKLNINAAGPVEIQASIRDISGNYSSSSKIFNA